MQNYTEISSISAMSRYADRHVSLTGKLSDMPWQHLIGQFPDYPFLYYFDKDGNQIAIYSRSEISCKKLIHIFGEVITAEGQSKRPGSEVVHREFQMLVHRWECGDR